MELKANELRIGNLLYYDNEVKEICSIHSDNTIRFKDKEKGSIGCFSVKTPLIKPITLTEEWLLKFGYTEEDFETGKIIIVTENNKLIGFIINKYSYSPVIKYVHQLQNLYFALTNEELTIKM